MARRLVQVPDRRHLDDVLGQARDFGVQRQERVPCSWVSDPDGGPVLLMIGSPMGAAGFGTLATHFTDRTIVTYDPQASSAASARTPPWR